MAGDAHRAAIANRVLITGGAGFLGASLAAALLAAGDDVHVLVRPETDMSRLAPLADVITLHTARLCDRPALDGVIAAARPDSVFHFAVGDRRAILPDLADAAASVTDDLAGLITLFAACAAAAQPPRVLVRAGSLAEYGPIAAPYDEAQREQPETAYAAGLVAGTHYARMLGPRLPFAVVTARLALVYGPGQSRRFLIPQLIDRCLAGETTRIERPDDRRDLIHIDDALAGLMAVARRPAAPIINICTGLGPRMADVASLIRAAAGAGSACVEIAAGRAPGGTPDLRGSPALARRVCGWQACIPLASGIVRTVEWYRRQQPQLVATC